MLKFDVKNRGLFYSLYFCICLKLIMIKMKTWVLLLKRVSTKYSNITKESMNHLKKNIEICFYGSTTQCKSGSVTICNKSSLFSPWTSDPSSSSEITSILHSVLYSPYFLYSFFYYLFSHNFTQMESCFMLTCIFNINFEAIHVDGFSCSIFLFTAASVLLYAHSIAFLPIL